MRRLALSLALAAPLACGMAYAGPLDADTLACALARAEPTDGNIEACTGQPVDLRPRSYAFLASEYTEDGAVIFVLDTSLSGSDCIARMESGITPGDAQAIIDERLPPSEEGMIPPPEFRPNPANAILSCEFDSYDW